MNPGQGRPAAHAASVGKASSGAVRSSSPEHRDARGEAWDVTVVGAGPAGSATAMRLARAGFRTLLVDRGVMPRPKVCGCCLSTTAVAELVALGPGDAAPGPHAALPPGAASLERVRVAGGSQVARMPLAGGAVVSREALDTWLVHAAVGAGCHWRPRTDVVAIDDTEPAADGRPLTVLVRDATAGLPAARPPDRIACRLVVIATGLADGVRIVSERHGAGPSFRGRLVATDSRVGLGAVLAPEAAALPGGELVMAVGRAGYCGLVRLEDGRIDVAAAVDPRALAAGAGPAEVVGTILDEALGNSARAWLDRGAVAAAMFRATPPLTHASTLVAGTHGRVLRVGDAAAYVEPFTGEGIGWALAAARLLADAIVAATTQGVVDPAVASRLYRAAHAAHFAPRHRRCRRVARGVRMPSIVAGAVGAARVAPWAARRVVPLLVGHADGSERIGRVDRPREGNPPR